jgi:dihydropteroate synthase
MILFGILNITEDSFSDGGEFFSIEKAIRKIESLYLDGTDIIDIGAQSSNIHSKQISDEEEWARLSPIIDYLKSKSKKISIDTFKPEVIEKCILANVDYINNINGFENPETLSILKKYKNQLPNLICMYSHNLGDIAKPKSNLTVPEIVPSILDFFKRKKREFLELGIAEEKIIFDTGMGFFLGEDPLLSLEVIKNIKTILNLYPRLLLSVSRKSFIGNLLGGVPPKEREVGTLAFEMFLSEKNLPYLRTHNVKQIIQARKIQKYLLS